MLNKHGQMGLMDSRQHRKRPIGPELVSNGTFDSDVTGWTGYFGGTPSAVGGQMKILGDASGPPSARATSPITTVVGSVYRVTYDYDFTNIGATIGMNVSNNADGGTPYATNNHSAGSSGMGTFLFTATATTTYIAPDAGNVDAEFSLWDNISVRLA